jgi:hypothetical protein
MRERLLVLDTAAGFLGDWQNGSTRSALGSKNELSWLPDGVTARAYSEYVKYGVTTDRTPPRKAPVLSSAIINSDLRQAMVRWTAEADLESGIRQFVVYRDGRAIAKVPEKVDDKTGFPQFQSITFHDTPPKDAPEMLYVDKNVSEGENPSYAVRMINGVGLESPKSAAVKAIR